MRKKNACILDPIIHLNPQAYKVTQKNSATICIQQEKSLNVDYVTNHVMCYQKSYGYRI
jgi:hypothetical protein